MSRTEETGWAGRGKTRLGKKKTSISKMPSSIRPRHTGAHDDALVSLEMDLGGLGGRGKEKLEEQKCNTSQ